MAICLGIILDTYFIDYNTKQDYQISNRIIQQSKKMVSK